MKRSFSILLVLVLGLFVSCETTGTRDDPETAPEYRFIANETTTYKLQLQVDYSGKILGFGEEGTLNITADVLLNCAAATETGYRLIISTANVKIQGGTAAIRSEVRKAMQGRMNFAINKNGRITSEFQAMSSDDALLLETFVLPVLGGRPNTGKVSYRQDPIRVGMDIDAKADESRSTIKWERRARLTDLRDNSSMGSILIAQSFAVGAGRLGAAEYEGDVTINVPAQSGGFTVTIPVKTRFKGKLYL